VSHRSSLAIQLGLEFDSTCRHISRQIVPSAKAPARQAKDFHDVQVDYRTRDAAIALHGCGSDQENSLHVYKKQPNGQTSSGGVRLVTFLHAQMQATADRSHPQLEAVGWRNEGQKQPALRHPIREEKYKHLLQCRKHRDRRPATS